jgi:hypothetical protein
MSRIRKQSPLREANEIQLKQVEKLARVLAERLAHIGTHRALQITLAELSQESIDARSARKSAHQAEEAQS